jgi:RTX calcium-binding nonapeptide repeat (4 copies)
MKVHAAVVALILVPSGLLGVSPARAAAAVCQGQPATIEGSSGTITGTEGNDVIVSTGTETDVQALGGNDLICVVGGIVHTGLGDDSVVSTGPVGITTVAFLFGGADTFVGGAGSSDVVVDKISSFHVTLGGQSGILELYPTTTPGTGTVDFGGSYSYLYAFGLHKSKVDLAAQTASIDDLLQVTTIGLRNATATGCKVRMKGNSANNGLDAYGHNIAVTGGGGRDFLTRVGNGFDLDLPPCGDYKSVFKGQGGPDRLYGRRGDDVLLGGRGHDVAQGAGGVDTCRAEVRSNCER